jgi:hypothetical protein
MMGGSVVWKVATVAWAVAFHAASFSSFVSLLFHAFVVEWLAFGLVISTLCWCAQHNGAGVVVDSVLTM